MKSVPLAAVVLCGGASRRMGTDKATLRVGGRPLALHVAERVSRAADPVFLAVGRGRRLDGLGYAVIEDEASGAGPVAGIAAGLAASPHALMAVVAVDMPFANPELLRLLAHLRAEEDAVVPVSPDGPEPLHAVYASAALPRVRDALRHGRRSARRLLQELDIRLVREHEWARVDEGGAFAVNLNAPQDLERLGLDVG